MWESDTKVCEGEKRRLQVLKERSLPGTGKDRSLRAKQSPGTPAIDDNSPPSEDAISIRTKDDEDDCSYKIGKRVPCKVEGIAALEVSNGDQVDRVPTEIESSCPIRAKRCEDGKRTVSENKSGSTSDQCVLVRSPCVYCTGIGLVHGCSRPTSTQSMPIPPSSA